MTRLRALLVAAAALVAGGTALTLALRNAGLSLVPPMTCSEWSRLVTEAQQLPPSDWFMAGASGYSPPTTISDRVLGECAAGKCVVAPQGCEASYSYDFDRSPAVNGWFLYHFRGPLYFAEGWRQLATAVPASAKFFEGWKDVWAKCTALATVARCLQMLDGAGACWKRAGGFYCRKGLLYGPGLGGVNADGSPATCAPAAGDVPYPCSSPDGERWADLVLANPLPPEPAQ